MKIEWSIPVRTVADFEALCTEAKGSPKALALDILLDYARRVMYTPTPEERELIAHLRCLLVGIPK